MRRADFDADYAAIRSVRFDVFVDEQHVPASIEMDDRDPFCIHVLAFDDAAAVGTGRIDLEASGKIGRLAVLSSMRGQGVGIALMEFLHAIAKDNALDSVWCNAQGVAVPFYDRLGYRVTGDPFDEADIEHVRMERKL
ncbi:GNAT family N-acetyltransferase [Candidatus Rariloculus sp.]|uniref:GNAT family N-acetyltransferase n=1 Tax=Candidatus Rariloculus sp. TaxID=3101265 RepID=UPI003D09BE9A